MLMIIYEYFCTSEKNHSIRIFSDFYLKPFEIKTTDLAEKPSTCSMLVCYAKELKEGFVNYVEETTKLMIPLLRFNFHKGKNFIYLFQLIKFKKRIYNL